MNSYIPDCQELINIRDAPFNGVWREGSHLIALAARSFSPDFSGERCKGRNWIFERKRRSRRPLRNPPLINPNQCEELH